MVRGEITINTGNYEIIDSGSIIISQDEHIIFEISNMKFDFLFINDDAEANAQSTKFRMILDDQDNNKLNIILNKVEDSFFGAPTNNMINVANYKGKPLYVSFAFQPINKKSETHYYVLFYTWYLKK